ncbi:MAG: caspase family protein [Myxococcota bacterium]|jgi:WD40 repeat protein|nr:caspase family protein [Myxococcota bacterium]
MIVPQLVRSRFTFTFPGFLLLPLALALAALPAWPTPARAASAPSLPPEQSTDDDVARTLEAYEPIARWRPGGGGPTSGRVGCATLEGHQGWAGDDLGLSLWVKGPRATLVRYTSPAGLAFTLACATTVRATLGQATVDTGVACGGDAWQHLGWSWDALAGEAVLSVDGRRGWQGPLRADRRLEGGGSLELGGTDGCGTTFGEVALFDQPLPHERWGRLVAVQRGWSPPPRPPASLPLQVQVQPVPASGLGLVGHDALRLHPGGRLLATFGKRTTRLWDVTTGALLRTFTVEGDCSGGDFHPFGHLLATFTDAGLELWDLETGERVAHHPGYNWGLFSPLGDRILVRQGQGRVWKSELRTFPGLELLATHDGLWFRAQVSADGQRCALFGDNEQTVLVLDGRTGQQVARHHYPTSTRNTLHPGGRHFLRRTELHDLATGRPLRTIPSPEFSYPVFSPDGEWVYLRGPKIHHLESGRERPFPPYSPDPDQVVFLDSARLITLKDGVLELVDLDRATRRRLNQPLDQGCWLDLSPDGRQVLVSQCAQGTVRWDLAELAPAARYEGLPDDANGTFSPDGRRMIMGQAIDWHHRRVVRELATGRVVATLPQDAGTSEAFSPDGRVLLTAGKAIHAFDGRSFKPLGRAEFPPGYDASGGNYQFRFSADGRWAVGRSFHSAKLFFLDARRGRIARVIDSGIMNEQGISADGQTVWTAGERVVFWNPHTGQELRRDQAGRYDTGTVAPDGSWYALTSAEGIRIHEAATGALRRTIPHAEHTRTRLQAIRTDLLRATVDERTFLYDPASGATRAVLEGDVGHLFPHPDGRLLVGSHGLGGFVVWNLAEGERPRPVRFLTQGADWLVFDEEGLFSASPGGARLIRLIRGTESFAVDRLAVHLNRPDRLLARLGLGAPELLAHLAARAEQRSRRLGVTAGASVQPDRLPRARILELETTGEQATLRYELRHPAGLAGQQIYVNGVPALPAAQRAAAGERLRTSVTLPLARGPNRIEVEAQGRDGLLSVPALAEVVVPGAPRGALHFLGFGVSKYARREYDLAYAHKDALDLAAALRGLPGYERIHVHTWTDAQVTPAAIQEARSRLAGAGLEDTVVVFVAGHGLYGPGPEARYYYLTHGAQVERLAETAADFALLEALVTDITPQRKLLLIDTCESGERDPEELNTQVQVATRIGVTARAIRGFKVAARQEAPAQPRRFQVNRERFLYTSLERRTGTLVLSSSGANELSYEDRRIANGFFTQALLDALAGKADLNADRTLDTTELRQYVIRTVAEATRELQHPRVDRDNPLQEFGFPLPVPD